jgi:ABC-type transporter Mla subunit MlaD
MPAKNNSVRIGVFVLLAIILFIAGLLAFGAKSYFSPKTFFETAVQGEVSGLSVGSPVQLRGVPVGKVTKIGFAWNKYPESKTALIIVEFEVDGNLLPMPKGTDIRTVVKEQAAKGLRAMVKGQGITGTSLLAIETITPPPPVPELDYTPRNIYIPSTPGQFTRMLEDIEKSLNNLQQLDFAAIGSGVTNVLVGFAQITAKLDKLDLEGIATNASGVLVEANHTIATLEDTIKEMKLGQVSEGAQTLLSSLQETSSRLQYLVVKLNQAPLQDTVSDLQQTLQTLNEVLLDLKRYPSGFFLGEPPPPVKALQPLK